MHDSRLPRAIRSRDERCGMVGPRGKARTERDDLRPKRVWVLRKQGREAAMDVKAVPGIGAEIVLIWMGRCARRACSVRTS